ncbi:MAG: 50S ribosomal protein L10 [Halobacteriota archaeon]
MAAIENVHRPVWKDDEVTSIKAEAETHKVIAVVSIHGIPARQFQNIRAELRDVARIKVARNTLIHRAFEEAGEATLKLFENVEGQTALVFTDLNPFKLFKLLENSRTPAPAKAGDRAPTDIIVEKGATSFRPGPIVGDLQNAGIPAAIEKGKIVIRETKTVAKAGEAISVRLAGVLQRLEIYPMEVGLYLRAAYDGDVLYVPEDLRIDEKAYFGQFVLAVSNALNLSINAAYPTSLTAAPLLQKASFEAMNLAVSAEIFEPEVLKTLLSRAQAVALTLVDKLPNEALDDELIALKDAHASVPEFIKEKPAQKKEDEESKEKEEDEAKESESGMEGLGALFG